MKKNGGMRGIGCVKRAKYIHLKGKIAGKTDKSRGMTKGHEGKGNNPGVKGAHDRVSPTTGRGEHHGVPVVASSWSRSPAP